MRRGYSSEVTVPILVVVIVVVVVEMVVEVVVEKTKKIISLMLILK